MKIYPRCHPEWIDREIPKNVVKRGPAYTGTGHMLPCCWCDQSGNEDIRKMGLLDDHMKLKNFKSVKEIFLTKEWVSFHKTLLISPENAPSVCKKKCSESVIEKELQDDE
jgi:hypothetical protein